MPDLTGETFSDAQTTLDAGGLNAAKKSVSSGKPAGTVVEQEPKAGTSVAKGSTVTLSVASAADLDHDLDRCDDDQRGNHDRTDDDHRGDHDSSDDHCSDDDCSPAADDGHGAGRDGPDRGSGGNEHEPGRDPRQHRLRAGRRIRSGP